MVHFPKRALGVDAASLPNIFLVLSRAAAGQGYHYESLFPFRNINDRLAADQHFLYLSHQRNLGPQFLKFADPYIRK